MWLRPKGPTQGQQNRRSEAPDAIEVHPPLSGREGATASSCFVRARGPVRRRRRAQRSQQPTTESIVERDAQRLADIGRGGSASQRTEPGIDLQEETTRQLLPDSQPAGIEGVGRGLRTTIVPV